MATAPSILLIDDDPTTRLAWRRRLEAQGYTVATAADGCEGLQAAIESPPTLVLLDKELPGMHGFAVCRALRAYDATRRTPVLMISADAEVPSRVQGLDAGADDYLGKDIADAELASRIRAALRLKDLQDQLGAERDKFDAVLRNLHEPLVICDRDDRILVASAAFLQLWRLPPEIAPLRTLDDVLAAVAVPAATRRAMRAADRRDVTFTIAPAGESIVLLGRAAPIGDGANRFTAYVFRDITRQVAHERMQAEFQSMIAHDLRSPLAVIQGYAALMATEKAGPVTPTQREFLGHVLQKVDELSELLGDFLEVSRLESGFVRLEREEIALAALVDDCVADLATPIREKSLAVTIEVIPEDLRLGVDPLRLRQILINLLSNAVKYNQSGGWIRVTGRRADQEIELAVADSGMGLSSPELAELFRPYRRGRAERRIKGIGLGLAIVKRLVEAHGGRIAAASRPGEGATFTVVLPVGLPLVPADAAPSAAAR